MSRTLTVSEETYQAIKAQLGTEDLATDTAALEEMIGKAFFFRTVTYHLTGRVKRFIGNIVVLEDAAWVADSGRFMQAIMRGTLKEVEPVGAAYLNLNSVTDFFPWRHSLPTEQK